MEQLARVGAVALDKTGTLTKGHFTVAKISPHGIKAEELFTLAAAVEQGSNHPLALALQRTASTPLPAATNISEAAGKGIVATVEGARIAVGNLALMQEETAQSPTAEDDGSVLYVARNGVYLGYILLTDTPKDGARDAITALKNTDVTRIVMLTGDRESAAQSTAAALGITEYRAGLLPTDKVDEIERLLAAPHKGMLLFVGDGINDAPVLARADVGVAMGALGSDAAIEAADIVLMDDDLKKLSVAIHHARRTVRIVQQNIFLTLAVKAVVLLSGALGLLGAWQMPLAIFADVGVCVLAILNAMRTLTNK